MPTALHLLRLLIACAALLLGSGAVAQGQNAIAVALVAEGRSAGPGETVALAFTMRPREGWHGYWENPGDAGVGARVQWQLPAGMSAAALRYPVPDRLIISGLMNYVFERDYALLSEVRIPADAAPGTLLPIRARIDYLACTDEICVPETATVATQLQVAAAPGRAENRAMFDHFRQALPRPLGSEGRFEIAGGRLRMAVPIPRSLEFDDPYFFPLTGDAIRYSAAQHVSRSGDMLIVETEAGPQAGAIRQLGGVLRIGEGQGLSLSAVPGAVPAAGAPVGGASSSVGNRNASTILIALLGALIGGLLLNVMPCVFPILSLKALSLAKAGRDEAAARREALAYTGGAVLVSLALGAAVLALRASGAAVGWAFQLQDPRVILLLLLLVIAIGLNLAGLFQLPSFAGGGRLAGSGGARGAFWTGGLAAFVATPCTGPFMGAALGTALILPTSAALAVFGGLGLGLALPFLALGFVPALRRRLPKPGPWMERFRRILSIPMFLTAVGLAWILGRQAGASGMTLGLGAALVLALGLWWAGRIKGKKWLPLLPAAVAVAAALLLVRTADPAPSEAVRAPLSAEPFSEGRLAALRGQGRPVFVYFTADWCITCKVNEEVVLDRSDVAETFRRQGVSVLVGDWTSGDAEIGRFLESHGRSGIPLYLFYAPGREPEILPQILTAGQLTALAS